MKKKYLLPTLKEEPRLINDDFWEEIDDIYDFLLNNMKLYYETSESVFDEGSNAMPHIFEQMLLFHRIFLIRKIRNMIGQLWNGEQFYLFWRFKGFGM